METRRKSNIELLRTVSMLFIVIHHTYANANYVYIAHYYNIPDTICLCLLSHNPVAYLL